MQIGKKEEMTGKYRPFTFAKAQNVRGEVAFWSKTTIKPVISRIRYFDTGLLDTDTIMVKVEKKH